MTKSARGNSLGTAAGTLLSIVRTGYLGTSRILRKAPKTIFENGVITERELEPGELSRDCGRDAPEHGPDGVHGYCKIYDKSARKTHD